MTYTYCRLALLFLFTMAVGLQAGEPAPSMNDLAKSPVDGKKASQSVAPAAEASPWRFSAGYQWRQLGHLDWQTGSMAAHASLPWLVDRPSHSQSGSGGALPPAGIGNHNYSDGFVNEDGGTSFDGLTGFWGYNNASQLQGNDLQFHASSSSTLSQTTAGASSSLRSSGWSDDLSGSGWFASLESPVIFKTGCIQINLELGYSYAYDGTSQATNGVFTAEQHSTTSTSSQSTTLTDHYNVTGLIVPLAPYAGSFGGPGPLINNAPTSRDLVSSDSGGSHTVGQTAAFSSNVMEGFDMHLHTISLGPNFSGEWNRFRFGLGLGLGLNVADWSASYSEELDVRQNGGGSRTLNNWNATSSDTKILPGFYLESNVEISITETLALFVGGRYDWARGLSETVGPSQFQFKLQGWTIQGGLTIRF